MNTQQQQTDKALSFTMGDEEWPFDEIHWPNNTSEIIAVHPEHWNFTIPEQPKQQLTLN